MEIIEQTIRDFSDYFTALCEERGLSYPEYGKDEMEETIMTFLAYESLTEAEDMFFSTAERVLNYKSERVNWSLSREELEKTEEYRRWKRFYDLRKAFYDAFNDLSLDEKWVSVNGKRYDNDKAAMKAAEKWCELLFEWHLQDNGALNEESSFSACALATVLGEEAKKNIPDHVKNTVKELMYEYYLRKLHYDKTHDHDDIKWLCEKLPDNASDKRLFNWNWEYYEFGADMYCDYYPSNPIRLILINAGVEEKYVDSICPWKTGIEIRAVDNAVIYSVYGKREEL